VSTHRTQAARRELTARAFVPPPVNGWRASNRYLRNRRASGVEKLKDVRFGHLRGGGIVVDIGLSLEKAQSAP